MYVYSIASATHLLLFDICTYIYNCCYIKPHNSGFITLLFVFSLPWKRQNVAKVEQSGAKQKYNSVQMFHNEF